MAAKAKIDDRDRDIKHVFVYGTLKRAFGNYRVIDGKSKYVGQASTRGIMLHLGGFPGLIQCDGGSIVHGELHEITDDSAWDGMDRLEGHPSFYQRTAVKIGNHLCYTYVYNGYDNETALNGFYNNKQHYHCVSYGNWGLGNDQPGGKTAFWGMHDGMPASTKRGGLAYVTVPERGFFGLVDMWTGIPRPGFVGPKPEMWFNHKENKWEHKAASILSPPTPIVDVAKLPMTKREQEIFDRLTKQARPLLQNHPSVTTLPVVVVHAKKSEPYVDALDPGEESFTVPAATKEGDIPATV